MEFLEACRRAKIYCQATREDCWQCAFFEAEALCALACEETIVLQKIDEHLKQLPITTRQSKFLSDYPGAKIKDGFLDVCPHVIDSGVICSGGTTADCDACRRKYWLTEIDAETGRVVILQ